METARKLQQPASDYSLTDFFFYFMHEEVKRYCNRPRITLIKASRAEPTKATQPGSDHLILLHPITYIYF